MITRISSTDELSHILSEIFLNRQNKVTKVSDDSVLNAFNYGISKIAQKAEKDIAIVESRLFPDTAYGKYLDEVAERMGVSPRQGASGSSTSLVISAEPGSQYLKSTHVFSGDNGIQFTPTEDVTINDLGFGYIRVRSIDSGIKTNISPLTINRVSPEPAGHHYITNDYMAIGGRDEEQDDEFRRRIKENPNIISNKTSSYLTQLFRRVNENVFAVKKEGVNQNGKLLLAIVTQNGIDLSDTELADILSNSLDYFSMTDLVQVGGNIGIELKNVNWIPIDVDFRLDLAKNVDPDKVRKDIQIAFTKYVDFRFWNPDRKVEWDDLLNIVKSTDGIKYVPDNYFNPSTDIKIPAIMIPRFRKFVMRDLEGNIIVSTGETLSPYYYK